jgi:hypothetical protein
MGSIANEPKFLFSKPEGQHNRWTGSSESSDVVGWCGGSGYGLVTDDD